MRIVTIPFVALAILMAAPTVSAQDTPGSKVRMAWIRIQERNRIAAEEAAAEEVRMLAERRAKREAWGIKNTERLARLAEQEAIESSERRARREAWGMANAERLARIAELAAERAQLASADIPSGIPADGSIEPAIATIRIAMDGDGIGDSIARSDGAVEDKPRRQRRPRMTRQQMRDQIEAEVASQEIGGAWSGPPVFVRPPEEIEAIPGVVIEAEPGIAVEAMDPARATAMAADPVSDDVRRARREAWAASHARKIAARDNARIERQARMMEIQERLESARSKRDTDDDENVALAMDDRSIRMRRMAWATAHKAKVNKQKVPRLSDRHIRPAMDDADAPMDAVDAVIEPIEPIDADDGSADG